MEGKNIKKLLSSAMSMTLALTSLCGQTMVYCSGGSDEGEPEIIGNSQMAQGLDSEEAETELEQLKAELTERLGEELDDIKQGIENYKQNISYSINFIEDAKHKCEISRDDMQKMEDKIKLAKWNLEWLSKKDNVCEEWYMIQSVNRGLCDKWSTDRADELCKFLRKGDSFTNLTTAENRRRYCALNWQCELETLEFHKQDTKELLEKLGKAVGELGPIIESVSSFVKSLVEEDAIIKFKEMEIERIENIDNIDKLKEISAEIRKRENDEECRNHLFNFNQYMFSMVNSKIKKRQEEKKRKYDQIYEDMKKMGGDAIKIMLDFCLGNYIPSNSSEITDIVARLGARSKIDELSKNIENLKEQEKLLFIFINERRNEILKEIRLEKSVLINSLMVAVDWIEAGMQPVDYGVEMPIEVEDIIKNARSFVENFKESEDEDIDEMFSYLTLNDDEDDVETAESGAEMSFKAKKPKAKKTSKAKSGKGKKAKKSKAKKTPKVKKGSMTEVTFEEAELPTPDESEVAESEMSLFKIDLFKADMFGMNLPEDESETDWSDDTDLSETDKFKVIKKLPYIFEYNGQQVRTTNHLGKLLLRSGLKPKREGDNLIYSLGTCSLDRQSYFNVARAQKKRDIPDNTEIYVRVHRDGRDESRFEFRVYYMKDDECIYLAYKNGRYVWILDPNVSLPKKKNKQYAWQRLKQQAASHFYFSIEESAYFNEVQTSM